MKEKTKNPDQKTGAKFFFVSKQDEKGWSSRYTPLFKIVNFLTKHNIVRHHWMHPPRLIQVWSHLIGGFLNLMPGMRKSIAKTMWAFFPDASPKRIKRLTRAGCNYYANLFLDLMFRLPLAGNEPLQEMFEYEDLHYLDEALEQAKEEGTGVIMLVLHTADFFHPIPAFSTHPNKYWVTSIANMSNNLIYQYIVNKKYFNRLYVYPSISFNVIGPHVEQRLKEGFVLVQYSDYSSKKHLRVPMIHGEYPYLVHTSQSTMSLQRRTGAYMVPVITEPNGIMGKTRFRVLDYKPLMKTINQVKDAPDKEFHGKVSTEVNKILYTWIRKYAHCWEEATDLGAKRITDSVNFEKEISVEDFVHQTLDKMNEIVEMSWEPNRDDEKLKNIIQDCRDKNGSLFKDPENEFYPHKTWIRLSKMGAIDELIKLCKVTQTHLKKRNEPEVVEIFGQMSEIFQNMKNE